MRFCIVQAYPAEHRKTGDIQDGFIPFSKVFWASLSSSRPRDLGSAWPLLLIAYRLTVTLQQPMISDMSLDMQW